MDLLRHESFFLAYASTQIKQDSISDQYKSCGIR